MTQWRYSITTRISGKFSWSLLMVSSHHRIQSCSGISTIHFLITRVEEEQILTSSLRTSAHMQMHRRELKPSTTIRVAGLNQLCSMLLMQVSSHQTELLRSM